MSKKKGNPAEEAIILACKFLEWNDTKTQPGKSAQELWEFISNVLKSGQYSQLVDDLEKNPRDPDTRNKATVCLAHYLEKNPPESSRLSSILARASLEQIPANRIDDLAGKDYNPYIIIRERPRFDYSHRMPNRMGDRGFAPGTPVGRWKDGSSPGYSPGSTTIRIPSGEKDRHGDETLVRVPETCAPETDAPAPAHAKERSTRVVNTGFSTWEAPDAILDARVPLASGQPYLFCVEIGDLWDKTIETKPVDIPSLPEKATVVSIVVFGLPDGVKVTPGADRGTLKIIGGKPGCEATQPIPGGSRMPSSGCLDSRLFFPVTMPGREGDARMRCNIYWRNILLQSRLVSAKVVMNPAIYPAGQEKVIVSGMDYSIAGTLDPAMVNALEPHCMSMMFNSNEGDASVFIEGSKNPLSVSFGGEEIADFLDKIRRRLRYVSWGTREEWTKEPYLYKDRERNLGRLQADLTNLARWGSSFFFQLCNRLEGTDEEKTEWRERLEKPGFIQVATKRSPNYLIPAALIYDYYLDADDPSGEYQLCQTFVDAFLAGTLLEDTPCFQGNCPAQREMKKLHDAKQGFRCTTICPSGFWGFRHYLGSPISLDNLGDVHDIPASIPVRDRVVMSACMSGEVLFLDSHEGALKKIGVMGPCDWKYVREEGDMYPVFVGERPHVVYFYCHGDLVDGVLQLRVGEKGHPWNFVARNLETYGIRWTGDQRPLIFLNGCQTAAVSPGQMLNFIEPLVTFSHGAGVIGTEITIFEELATDFSEHFFEYFLQGKPVGEAVRHARLALLNEGNPLGLVYTPYILPSMRLTRVGN